MNASDRRGWTGMAVFGLAVLSAVIAGCGEEETLRFLPTPTAAPVATPSRSVIVFNGENNDLKAYDPNDAFRKQQLGADDNLDFNGQICFDPTGSRRFVLGEDRGQPVLLPGWAILQLNGSRVGELSVTKLGKLVPTYQAGMDNPENYGCGFLSDGRILTTDVGNQADGPGTGQLIIWFPPFDVPTPRYCKLDVALGTAGGIYVDTTDRIYVASARVEPSIYRYTGPFPTSDTAAGGCGGHDATGAPRADSVQRERFIPADGSVRTPNAIVASGHGTFYVSSVLNGVIAEYDSDGGFVRRVLNHPAGESLGPTPFSTGSPLGLGIDSSGTLYYADIGLVQDAGGIGPGNMTGTVRRLRFQNGEPLPPETMDTGLSFPDGIGVLEQ